MIITALFPGSFDPVHYGHLDIAVRASKLFDRLIVGVYASPDKRTVLFTQSERIEMFSRAVADYPNIEVVGYDGLTVQFAKKIGASVMVRGLRVFSDFDYEFRMALANQEIHPDIETVSLITHPRFMFLSSSTVKEIVLNQGDPKTMVPPHVKERFLAKVAEKPRLS